MTANEVKRRPGGRSARVRAAVLEATVEELAAGGYAKLSLEAVAARAGVNKTTLYRRWGTREALLLDAMLARARERVPVRDTGSLRGDLVALARAVVVDLRSPVAQALIRTVAGLGPRDPAIAEMAKSFWEERLRLDGAIVERAIERGEVPPATDPGAVVESLLGPLYMRLLVTGRALDARFVDQVVDVVIDGIAAR
jgi:AcrR family transcriptional regulator